MTLSDRWELFNFLPSIWYKTAGRKGARLYIYDLFAVGAILNADNVFVIMLFPGEYTGPRWTQLPLVIMPWFRPLCDQKQNGPLILLHRTGVMIGCMFTRYVQHMAVVCVVTAICFVCVYSYMEVQGVGVEQKICMVQACSGESLSTKNAQHSKSLSPPRLSMQGSGSNRVELYFVIEANVAFFCHECTIPVCKFQLST